MSYTASDLAQRVQELRRIFLRSVFSFRPFIDPICSLAREVLPTEARLVAATEALRSVARDLPDAELGPRRRAFEAARDDLARAVDAVDEKGLFADLVVADLIGIEAGQESGLSMKLAPPVRNGSFLLYVTTVRRNHQALWSVLSSAA